MKELIKLRASLVVFGILAVFVFLRSPYFPYSYTAPSIDDVDSLATAAQLLIRQHDDLNEMSAQLNKFKFDLLWLLLFFGGAVLTNLYAFAKVIVPSDNKTFSLLDYRSDE